MGSRASQQIVASIKVFKRPVSRYELLSICGYTQNQLERALREGVIVANADYEYEIAPERKTDMPEWLRRMARFMESGRIGKSEMVAALEAKAKELEGK